MLCERVISRLESGNSVIVSARLVDALAHLRGA